LVYIRIVSVINLRVSIYSVVLQYFIYYVIIMITYLLMCVLTFVAYGGFYIYWSYNKLNGSQIGN
jgi:hypothetical protein